MNCSVCGGECVANEHPGVPWHARPETVEREQARSRERIDAAVAHARKIARERGDREAA